MFHMKRSSRNKIIIITITIIKHYTSGPHRPQQDCSHSGQANPQLYRIWEKPHGARDMTIGYLIWLGGGRGVGCFYLQRYTMQNTGQTKPKANSAKYTHLLNKHNGMLPWIDGGYNMVQAKLNKQVND